MGGRLARPVNLARVGFDILQRRDQQHYHLLVLLRTELEGVAQSRDFAAWWADEDSWAVAVVCCWDPVVTWGVATAAQAIDARSSVT